MAEELDPQIGEDLLKGRSKELDGDTPQSILSRLEQARLDLAAAVEEAKAAISGSPATPLFEEKLATDASVPVARIDVTADGSLVVVYSVAEQDEPGNSLEKESNPAPSKPKKSKRTVKRKDDPADLLLELEKMLEKSKSGYRGLPLPRMREIAELLECSIEKHGRKKIRIHEELVKKARLASGNEVPESEEPQEAEMVEEPTEEVSNTEESGSGSVDPEPPAVPATSGNDDGGLDLDDIDFENLFDDDGEEEEDPSPPKKMMKTGDAQPVTVLSKKESPLAGLHEAAAKRKDFRS